MANFDQILESLAKQLNVRQDSLKAAIQTGNPKAVAALLNGKQAEAFQKILSDPQAAKKILNSKEALELQDKLKP